MRVSVIGSRLAGAALAGLLICAPPPASARGGHHGSRGHHRHHDRHHEHGDWCAPRRDYGHSYGYRPEPAYGWYAPRYVEHARYRCEPCGHWYDDEAAFHGHIHRHHHITQALIPMVIGAAAFGWIFYGH